MKYVKVSAKIMVRTKDFIVLYQMYLWEWEVFKKYVNYSKIVSGERMHVMDIVSANMTNIMPTNVSTKKDGTKARLCTVLLMIILLLKITIICYHYAKHRSKQKHVGTLTK